jgi:hypothetical protein
MEVDVDFHIYWKQSTILSPLECCLNFAVKSALKVLQKKARDKNLSKFNRYRTSIYLAFLYNVAT